MGISQIRMRPNEICLRANVVTYFLLYNKKSITLRFAAETLRISKSIYTLVMREPML
jgi:5-bromo-4-chloroindolyl phosphate hydrolysis protein